MKNKIIGILKVLCTVLFMAFILVGILKQDITELVLSSTGLIVCLFSITTDIIVSEIRKTKE